MKSTPRAALLAEAAIVDPEYRRKKLTINFLRKIVGIRNHPILEILMESRTFLITSGGYTLDSKITYLMQILNIKKLYKSRTLPYFEIKYINMISPIKIVNGILKKNDLTIKEKLKLVTEKYRNISTFAYSDASKGGNSVGFGLTIPDLT